MKVDLADADGGNVISIEVARRHRFEKTCQHHSIFVDVDLAEIECRNCGKQLSPVEWIAMMAEEWSRVQNLYNTHREAAKLFDEKTRCKCVHCGKLTTVNPPDRFDSRLREALGPAT